MSQDMYRNAECTHTHTHTFGYLTESGQKFPSTPVPESQCICIQLVWVEHQACALVLFQLSCGNSTNHSKINLNKYSYCECFKSAACVSASSLIQSTVPTFLLLRFLLMPAIQIEALLLCPGSWDVPFLYTLPVASTFCTEEDRKTA